MRLTPILATPMTSQNLAASGFKLDPFFKFFDDFHREREDQRQNGFNDYTGSVASSRLHSLL